MLRDIVVRKHQVLLDAGEGWQKTGKHGCILTLDPIRFYSILAEKLF
jgi:hypothetical protein